MGCNCGRSTPQTYKAKQAAVPNITNGTNQILLNQIREQQRQQQAIQQIITKSANPTRTLIKTYR